MVNTNTADFSEPSQSFNPKFRLTITSVSRKFKNTLPNYINADWIDSLTATTSERSRRLSPPAFRYQLTELAQSEPEAYHSAGRRPEPRTVKAAAICAERGIATCVLLGNPAEINRVAASQGVELGASIENR